MPVRFTVGTHNLHDDAGTVTLFADLVMFTESAPPKIRAKVRAATSRSRARLAGYKVFVCRRQRDLVIVAKRSQFKRDYRRRRQYRRYVEGVAKVTPHRGTFFVPLIHRESGRRIWAGVEHRINAAFPQLPDRGEREFRRLAWGRHTAGTLASMAHKATHGHLVVCGGDANTPHGVRAYPGYDEVGEHFDRIGSTAWLHTLEVLSRVGSDHHRRRAVLEET